MGLTCLNGTECRVLFSKYKREGLNSEQAKERIDKINKKLRELVIKLKAKKKTPEEINERFKKEFERLAQKY